MLQGAVPDPPPCTSALIHACLSSATFILHRLGHPHSFQVIYHRPEHTEMGITVNQSRRSCHPPAPCLSCPCVPSTCPYGCSEHHGVMLSPMRQDWTDLCQGLVLFSWYNISVGNFLACLWPAHVAMEHPSSPAMFSCIQGL